jgi:hypothetical protein
LININKTLESSVNQKSNEIFVISLILFILLNLKKFVNLFNIDSSSCPQNVQFIYLLLLLSFILYLHVVDVSSKTNVLLL